MELLLLLLFALPLLLLLLLEELYSYRLALAVAGKNAWMIRSVAGKNAWMILVLLFVHSIFIRMDPPHRLVDRTLLKRAVGFLPRDHHDHAEVGGGNNLPIPRNRQRTVILPRSIRTWLREKQYLIITLTKKSSLRTSSDSPAAI